jgi:hypothetical protein
MSIILKIVGTGLLFLFTIVTGIWLSNSGKPLNTLIFTVHKLLALASVIFTIISVYNLLKLTEIKVVILALIIVTGLFVLALFISGALLSLGKSPFSLIKSVHNVASILAVVTTTIMIYLLISKK